MDAEPTHLSAEAPRPRFCARCGSLLAGEPGACPACPVPGQIADPYCAPARSIKSQFESIRSALVIYFSLLIVSAAAAIALVVMDAEVGSAEYGHLDVVMTIVFALVVILSCARSRSDVVPLLKARPRLSFMLAAPPLALATFAIASLCVQLSAFLAESLEYSPALLSAGYGIPVVFLVVSICPAIFEELAFRGAIQTRLARALGRRDSILVTALLFATIHLSAVSFPHLLIIGLLLGWLRVRSGSLYPGMILHACHNALCVAAELWSP